MCLCGGGDVLSVTVAVDCMKCDRQVNSKLRKSYYACLIDLLYTTLQYITIHSATLHSRGCTRNQILTNIIIRCRSMLRGKGRRSVGRGGKYENSTFRSKS
jgi:hypothetical protein